MRGPWAYLAFFLGNAVLLTGCDFGEPSTGSDLQRVKVFFKFDFRDQVDTFTGTLTKDLVQNGTVTVPFGFTESEQDSLVTILDHTGFFGLPDTLYPMPNVSIFPDPGFQVLRVEFEGTAKALVWMAVLDSSDPRTGRVRELWTRLRDLVQSTDTYRQLPPAEGAYL
jgi:hypothetical protein